MQLFANGPSLSLCVCATLQMFVLRGFKHVDSGMFFAHFQGIVPILIDDYLCTEEAALKLEAIGSGYSDTMKLETTESSNSAAIGFHSVCISIDPSRHQKTIIACI